MNEGAEHLLDANFDVFYRRTIGGVEGWAMALGCFSKWMPIFVVSQANCGVVLRAGRECQGE